MTEPGEASTTTGEATGTTVDMTGASDAATGPSVEPEVTTSTVATTGDRPRRSTRLATAAQIAGIIGIVVCVAIILGTWYGRGALADAGDGLATTVDGAFDRATNATTQVAARLDAAAANAADLAATAQELEANPAPPPDALAGLADKVGRLADTYRSIRTGYADLRENVTSAVTAIQQVSRFFPGVQAPEGAGDRLQAVDAKLQSIDDTLTGIFPALETGQRGTPVASAVAARATSLQAAFTDASASVAGLTARIDDIHAQATNARNTIGTIITLAAGAITLLFVWVLLLNAGLWVLGRQWKREAARGT
jgi:hypothetical protein